MTTKNKQNDRDRWKIYVNLDRGCKSVFENLHRFIQIIKSSSTYSLWEDWRPDPFKNVVLGKSPSTQEIISSFIKWLCSMQIGRRAVRENPYPDRNSYNFASGVSGGFLQGFRHVLIFWKL